uniref:Histone H1 n=6 Tax=Tigriopus californicus TaxID=6832 RepID=H1_TIGCA|nr:RecName: Full=Histone H1 [Tigriopus californicus]AAA12276.1 histone H1 [Tigriopus californicus]AAC41551.1 histone H1 [Tigriopus californicus]
MTETTSAKPKKVSKPKAKPTHPPTSVMVMAAIKALKERNGSSLPAIKKYIAANYKVDVVKNAHFIKKALKSLVEKKKLVQTKGAGASGSFKLAAAAKAEKPKAVAKPKKAKTPKKKAAATKKPTGEKKAKTPKKKPAAKKPAAAKPKKAKTPKKKAAPAKKTPVKKVKKTSPKKKAAPKKK